MTDPTQENTQAPEQDEVSAEEAVRRDMEENQLPQNPPMPAEPLPDNDAPQS